MITRMEKVQLIFFVAPKILRLPLKICKYQKMNMTERKSQFQKLIESQCRTLKKDKLIYICDQYAHRKLQNTSKDDMTKVLFNKIMKDLKKMKDEQKTAQEMQKFLFAFWEKYQLNRSTNKQQVLKSTALSFSNDQELIQIVRPLSVPNLNQRAVRQPLTQIAMNILNDSKKCICQQGDKHEKVESLKQPCYYCGAMLHPQCLWPKDRKDDVFECPFCFLKLYNPARQVKEAVCASYLFKKNRQKCETKIKFNVPFQLKKDKSAIFQLRCIRLGCKLSKYQITFPDSCSISVNGKKISEFKPLAKNSPLKRRPDQQIKIQKNLINFGQNELKIDEKGVTHIKQQYPGKAGKYDHIIMVVAVYPRTLAEIKNNYTQKFNQKNSISITHLQEVIKKNSLQQRDLQIQKIKIPMYCQFYGGSILIPVRSRHCTHNYAFDAKNFFMAMLGNTKTSALKWKCPLCKKRSYDLVLDKYQDKKIKQIIVNPKDITLNKIQIIEQQADSNQEDPNENQKLNRFKSMKSKQNIKADINIDDDSVQIDQGYQEQQRIDYHDHEIRNTSSEVYTANRNSGEVQNDNEDQDSDQIIEISPTQFRNLEKKQPEKDQQQQTSKQIKRNAEYQLSQQEHQSKGIRKMKVIQLDSEDQESEEAAYKRRLEQHRKQLQEMRRFSSRKCKDNIIRQQDVRIYEQVCKRLLRQRNEFNDFN